MKRPLTTLSAAIALVAAVVQAPLQGAAAATTLADVLAAAREALGGEQTLAKVTGLSAEGTYRRSLGPRDMSGDLELAIAFPDRYLRVESFSFTGDAGSRMIRSLGFSQDEPLDGITGGGPNMVIRMGGPGAEDMSEAERLARQVRVHRMEASRLALALLMRGDAVNALALTYAGEAEADDGKADVIEATFQNAVFRVFVDKQTHLPLVMSWREPAPRIQTIQRGPGSSAPSPEERERMMREARERAEKDPPKMAGIELFLSDYKKVDGVMLPHTFRRSMDGTVDEEWTITKFNVSPTFKADTFKKR